MGQFDLNLSTRPFPAYRATNLLLVTVLVVLVALSLWQVVGFFRFTSLAGVIRNEERQGRVDSEFLARRLSELQAKLDRPEATAKLNEINFLNGLIARKSFSWTRIFASLENLVPETVHLLSLKPSVTPGGAVFLQIDLRGRSISEVSRFIEALEESPAYDDVIVSWEEKRDPNDTADVEVALTVNYFPEKIPQ